MSVISGGGSNFGIHGPLSRVRSNGENTPPERKSDSPISGQSGGVQLRNNPYNPQNIRLMAPSVKASVTDARYGPFKFVPAQVAQQETQLNRPIFEPHPKHFREVGVLYTGLNRYFPAENTTQESGLASGSLLPSQKALDSTLQRWFLVRFPTKTETVTLSEKDYQATFRKLHAYLEKIDNTALRAMVLTAVDHLLACETPQKGKHVFDFSKGAHPLPLPVLSGPKPVLRQSYGLMAGAAGETLFQAMGTALLPHLTPRLDDPDKTIVVARPRLSRRDFMDKPAPDIAVQHRFFHDSMGALGDNASARQTLCDARLATSPTLGLQLFRELLQSSEFRTSETDAVVDGLNTAFFAQSGVARLENMRDVLAARPAEKEALKHAVSVLYAMCMQPDGPSVSEIHGQLKGGLLSGCTVETLDVLLRQFPRLFSGHEIVLPQLLGDSPKQEMVQAYLDMAAGNITDDQLSLSSELEIDDPVYQALQFAEADRERCFALMSFDLVVPNVGGVADKFYHQIRSKLNTGSLVSVDDGTPVSPNDKHAKILTDLCAKWLLDQNYDPTKIESRVYTQHRSAFEASCREAGVVSRPFSLHNVWSNSQNVDENGELSSVSSDDDSCYSFEDGVRVKNLKPLKSRLSSTNFEEKENTEQEDMSSDITLSLKEPLKLMPYEKRLSVTRSQVLSPPPLDSTDIDPYALLQPVTVRMRPVEPLVTNTSSDPLSWLAREKPVLDSIVDLKTRQRETFAGAMIPAALAEVRWILKLPAVPTRSENLKKAYVFLHAILHVENGQRQKAIAADLGISSEALAAKYEEVKHARIALEMNETYWASPLERRVATQLLDFYRNNSAEKAVDSGGKVNPKLTKVSAELEVLYQAASDNPRAFERFSKVFFFSGDHDRFWRDMQRLQDNPKVCSRLVAHLQHQEQGHSRSSLLMGYRNQFHEDVVKTKSEWQSFFSPTLPSSLVLSRFSLQRFAEVKLTLSAPVLARIGRFQAMSRLIRPADCQLPSDRNALSQLSKVDRDNRNNHRALLWHFSRSGATIFENTSKAAEIEQRTQYRNLFISALANTKTDANITDLRAHIQINQKACDALDAAFAKYEKDTAIDSACAATNVFPLFPTSDLGVHGATFPQRMAIQTTTLFNDLKPWLGEDADTDHPPFVAFLEAVVHDDTNRVFIDYPNRTWNFVSWLIERAQKDMIDGVLSEPFKATLKVFQDNIETFGGEVVLETILAKMLGEREYDSPEHSALRNLLNMLFPGIKWSQVYNAEESLVKSPSRDRVLKK